MSIEIKVPQLPESVSDATIAAWYKAPGEAVSRDDHLVDIETDKVVLEVVAPDDGVMVDVLKAQGATVTSEEVIGMLAAGDAAVKPVKPAEQKSEEVPAEATEATEAKQLTSEETASSTSEYAVASPSVRKLAMNNSIDLAGVKGTGKHGRVVKQDVENMLQKNKKPAPAKNVPDVKLATAGKVEKRVPMTRLRAKIAERLVQAQHTAAILTTFNEVNMQPVMDLRAKYKESFEKKHGVRLGFMSFFTKAAVEALKRFPAVNASIDGDDIVYHGYFDIGIAVSSPRGLVVPVIRGVDTLSMAEIEQTTNHFGKKARDGKLTIEEMTGGTFTISNGGVFGSLLSTPILNPPQSGILGMHKIEQRVVVENGEIVVRPMMYLALSYDHRIIDGSESVRFLVTIKEMLEDPARLLIGV